jgi:putative phosphoribosyl transferase
MFENRTEAGKQLAEKLSNERKNSLIIALPRGGVAVGFPIAQKFKTNLEVIIARKLGLPNNPELGVGAIAEDGIIFLDREMVDLLQITTSTVKLLREKEEAELERRKKQYRNGKSLPLLTNKTIILVDDGLATGVTALLSLKKHHPKKIIFAVPVCSSDTMHTIRPLVDSMIYLNDPKQLDAIGRYYRNFDQLTDEEVVRFLQTNNEELSFTTREDTFANQIVW